MFRLSLFQSRWWRVAIAIALIETLLKAILIPPAAIAQISLIDRIRGLFTEQQEVGVAGNRSRGAATRNPDKCRPIEPSAPPLTALLPDSQAPILTDSEHPAFWFYVPYALTSDPAQFTLRFVLQNEQHQTLYETRFAVAEPLPQGGVISLRFPSPKAALEVGQSYRWYFLIYCDDTEEVYAPAFVDGTIQREMPNLGLMRELEQAPLQDRFLLYAQARLWYDTLAALDAQSATANESALATAWAAVLQGVGLTDAAMYQRNRIVGRFYVPPDQ